MKNAFIAVFEEGFSKIALIGSDCNDLTSIILNGFDKLEENRVLLGPALDGGYYIIAMRSPFIDLFNEIKWSSPYVLEVTK